MSRAKDWFLRYRKELIIGAAIFLISTMSFALGYLTARDERMPIIIEQRNESVDL